MASPDLLCVERIHHIFVSTKGKLSDDLAPMDRSNGEEQVKSRSMNQYGHVMI